MNSNQTELMVVGADEVAITLRIENGYEIPVKLTHPRRRFAVVRREAGGPVEIVSLHDTHDEASQRFYELLGEHGALGPAEIGTKS